MVVAPIHRRTHDTCHTNAWKIAVNKAKIDTVIIAGNNANERETAGGTPSGMLMTKRGCQLDDGRSQ